MDNSNNGMRDGGLCLQTKERADWAPSTAKDNVSFVEVSRQPCRVIDLTVELSSDESADHYVFVFNAASKDAVINAPDESKRVMLQLAPKKVSPGGTVSWAPPTRWTPFNAGVVVMLGTSDDVADINTQPSFSVSWHFMLD